MNNPGEFPNKFQQAAVQALRDTADDHGFGITNEHTRSHFDGPGIAFDIAGVPIEIASDQISIASPYNQRVFEERSYGDLDELIEDLTSVIAEFAGDPLLMRHPAVRFWRRLFG